MVLTGFFHHAHEVVLFGSDQGEFVGPAKTFRGGLVVVEPEVEFSEDGVEQMVVFESVAIDDLGNSL